MCYIISVWLYQHAPHIVFSTSFILCTYIQTAVFMCHRYYRNFSIRRLIRRVAEPEPSFLAGAGAKLFGRSWSQAFDVVSASAPTTACDYFNWKQLSRKYFLKIVFSHFCLSHSNFLQSVMKLLLLTTETDAFTSEWGLFRLQEFRISALESTKIHWLHKDT